jgi:mono/diheme cytochrome c family protein
MSNVSKRNCIARKAGAAGIGAASFFAGSMLVGVAALAQGLAAGTIAPQFPAQAATTFKQRCTACHTFGNGTKVGPDLRGVTERRSREWLTRFVRSSSALIASGDPVAIALFAEFKGQRMPDWIDLTEKEVAGILDYLAAGAPDSKPADERTADTATPAEVDLGRRLFDGTARFEYGAQRCGFCHTAGGPERIAFGTLGPDLRSVCVDHGEKEMTSLLRRPCFAWDPQPGKGRYLTPEESFALKALLCRPVLATAIRSAPAAGGGRQ